MLGPFNLYHSYPFCSKKFQTIYILYRSERPAPSRSDVMCARVAFPLALHRTCLSCQSASVAFSRLLRPPTSEAATNPGRGHTDLRPNGKSARGNARKRAHNRLLLCSAASACLHQHHHCSIVGIKFETFVLCSALYALLH